MEGKKWREGWGDDAGRDERMNGGMRMEGLERMGEWRNGGKNGEGKGWRGEEEMEGWMEGLREGWSG